MRILIPLVIGLAACKPSPMSTLPAPLTAASATILVGDLHGTHEIPAFVGDLVATLAADRPVVVALEIPTIETPSFDAYLHSDGGPAARVALLADPWWRDRFQDGRRSLAMAALLERLRDLRARGARVAVARIDETTSDRDAAMAHNVAALRTQHPDATLVVYAGNLHTLRNGSPELPGVTFMAGHLQRAGLRFVALDARYERGTAWVCTSPAPDSCGPLPVRGVPLARGIHMEPTPDGNYDGWYGVGPLSASPPATK